MLTGCYPPKHGVRGLEGYTLSGDLRTMAESFRSAAYRTYAEVTGPLLPATGVLRGFDDHHHRQAYRVPFFGWRDNVVAAMRAYAAPWFLLLHIWEVHKPYRAPPDFAKRDDKAGYEAAVTATDEWLAPVFEAAGEDALTVVTGDHGEDYTKSFLQSQVVRQSRRARRYLKLGSWLPPVDRKLASAEIGHGFSLDEHHVRVPLIMAGPGVPATRVRDQVRHVDLLPTFAELCDLEDPRGIDGRSVVPLMRGQDLPEEPAYMEAVGVKLGGDRVVGARIPGFKLLRRGNGRPKLRHLVEGDAGAERRDVIKDHPEVAARLDDYIAAVQATETASASGMTSEEEAVVEQHLRDLGYL